eukprot:724458_1
MPTIPKNLKSVKENVFVETLNVKHTRTSADPDAFAAFGIDDSISPKSFKDKFAIDFKHDESERLSVGGEDVAVFDLVGVDAPFANAIRRILISEIPTMAVEKVNIYQNTSIIQDEVLAHRIGLIPIKVDPRKFKPLQKEQGGTGKMNPLNTIVFTLCVKCERNKNLKSEDEATATDEQKYINAKVTAAHMKWVPQGNQASKFANNPIRPVYDDILIAKLRPGQEIELEMFCELGIGKDHAKWSPVSTASYRLLPDIVLPEPVEDEDADELVNVCPLNVFDIEEIGNRRRAKVSRPRDCTMCRECIREPGWEDRVKLLRKRDHFIFKVESVGMFKAKELFGEAVKVLKKKCLNLLTEMDSMEVVESW